MQEFQLDLDNNILPDELVLTENPYWVDFDVRSDSYYRITGYSRSNPNEKKDASLILFDFGDYEMDDKTCQRYGLKNSAVGTYSYLPVGSSINMWSFGILVPFGVKTLRLGLRTWKNNGKVILGKNIKLVRDVSVSRLALEKKDAISENQRLHLALLRERQSTRKIRQTLSFGLGYLAVHVFKSWRNFLFFPYDSIKLIRSKKQEIRKRKEGRWENISQTQMSRTIKVSAGQEVCLGGDILTAKGEKKNAALIKVEFVGVGSSGEIARNLGLRYSDQLGFYEYLPTDGAGEKKWKITFKVPQNCTKIILNWLPWYSKYPVWVCCLENAVNQGRSTHVHKRYIEKLDSIYRNDGCAAAQSYIEKTELENNHVADLYEYLASLVLSVEQGKYYLEAFKKDQNNLRATRLLRRIVDAGCLGQAEEVLNALEGRYDEFSRRDLRNINYARGYVSLNKKLPRIPLGNADAYAENKYKVLMVLHASLPFHSNGYAVRSHSILYALRTNSEYEVTAVTRSGYPVDVGENIVSNSDCIDGVLYSRLLDAHYYDQPIDEYMLTSAKDVESFLIEKEPSIVHAASAFYNGIPALIAARRLGLPFVYEVRGLWEVTRASTLPGWGDTERFALECRLETLIAKEADQVIAITEGLKGELVRRGVDRSKITVIPNAINQDHFKPIKANQELKEKIGLKEVPTIGYVGSIVDYEGINLLVDALALLKRDRIAFNFLLVGDGNSLGGIKEQIAKVGIGDSSFVLGRVPHDDVLDYYSLIDIAPFPRKAVPVCELVSPLKPFEAMVQEKAVIASNVEALKEVISHGKTGFLFEKGSAQDLYLKLKELINNCDLRGRLARSGKDWVLKNREWSNVVSLFDDVYDKAFALNREKIKENINIQKSSSLSLLVYGDLNLNFIDGSAVWACSLVEMLSGLKGISITFLLKADLVHDTVVASLRELENVEIIEPSSTRLKCKLLTPEQAISVLEELQVENEYDGVILRGFDLNRRASERDVFKGILWPYMIDIFHIKDKWDKRLIGEIDKIIKASYVVFCQTTYIQDFLETKVPGSLGKCSLLPPMIPDQPEPNRLDIGTNKPFKIVYAGKFAPLWGTREMFLAFKELRRNGLSVELHIYGDKIHNPPEDPKFRSYVEKLLNSGDGVVWHKGQPRAEVINAMRSYDMAWAWRLPDLELATDEVSTKFLEYSSVGLPMVAVGNKITTRLLGANYPLFVDSFADLVPTITSIVEKPDILQRASETVYQASLKFSFSSVRHNYIEKLVDPLRSKSLKKTILFSGHDLKFVEKLMEKFRSSGHAVIIDNWQGHNKHDEVKSRELLEQADAIFCEWCLGNAVWYSHNKKQSQKLFIRFHRQEIETNYPEDVNFESVDSLVFIAPHIKRKAIERYSLKSFLEEIIYIPNYVDSENIDLPKSVDSMFNLGIVGIVPRMKRFDRALDILEKLRKKDKRYQLFVKGKQPEDYPWMLSRPDEMKYYEDLNRRIAKSDNLKGAVHFDGFDRDMGNWYRKIGYILSTSDFEGSHLSVAEAMATGCYPVIISWDGADEIYPGDCCFNDLDEAVSFINSKGEDAYIADSCSNKEFVKDFNLGTVYDKWEQIVI